MIGRGLCCRELSISKLWQKQTKKQAQQKLHTADHINDLGPPVQLGIMDPGYSIIFQSQIAVLNHSIEGIFIENSSVGDSSGFFFPEIFHLTYSILSCSQSSDRHFPALFLFLIQFYVQCPKTLLKMVFKWVFNIYIRGYSKNLILHICQVCWELGIKRINIYRVLLFVNLGLAFKTSSDSEKGRSEENGVELKCFQGEVREADSECSHGLGFKFFLFCLILFSEQPLEDKLVNSTYEWETEIQGALLEIF